MKTDLEIKLEAMEILLKYMDNFEVERFFTLIQREKFDYTKWRSNLFVGMSGREISKKAMEYKRSKQKSKI